MAVASKCLVMAIALAVSFPAAAQQQPCQAALCQADTLARYFEKLSHAQEHIPGTRPVHILQIGDSHTAGDAITGAWRELLQARYGGGGRGALPAGRPYQGYLTYGVTASMSPGWVVKSTFGRDSKEPRPPIGLSGFSLTAQTEGATLGLDADPEQAFDRFVVCALAQPGAGSLSIRVGFNTVEFNLASFVTRAECKTVTTPETQLSAQVVAHNGPVTITSWASFHDAGGIAISNMGVVGSQFVHFGRTDDGVIAEELRAYRPDLIVLAFGTNEGFAPRIEPTEYEIVLRNQIARIRRLAGNVPLLMLAAPDGDTRNPALATNAPGSAIDCNAPPTTIGDIMASLRASEAAGPGARTPVNLQADPGGRPLFVPPGMAVVRDVQRRVAADLNIAFWDWQARMGGACTAMRWVKADLPLMRGDFIHFNKAGGWEIAKLLQADLAVAAASNVTRSDR